MKNIEKHFDKLKDILKKGSSMHCQIHHFRTGNSGCSGLSCDNCFIESLAWLNEEYHELIKLTKFEYGLLSVCTKDMLLINHGLLNGMLDRGYFKGVSDTNMRIGEILNHCEVVE